MSDKDISSEILKIKRKWAELECSIHRLIDSLRKAGVVKGETNVTTYYKVEFDPFPFTVRNELRKIKILNKKCG